MSRIESRLIALEEKTNIGKRMIMKCEIPDHCPNQEETIKEMRLDAERELRRQYPGIDLDSVKWITRIIFGPAEIKPFERIPSAPTGGTT